MGYILSKLTTLYHIWAQQSLNNIFVFRKCQTNSLALPPLSRLDAQHNTHTHQASFYTAGQHPVHKEGIFTSLQLLHL